MSSIDINVEISNEFASIEKRYSSKAEIRLSDLIADPTDKLPLRRKDLVINNISIDQVRELAEVLNIFISATADEQLK